MIDIGLIISILRKQRGLSQKDLANKVGMSSDNISRIERNAINTGTESLLKICDALDITPVQFFLTDPNQSEDSQDLANWVAMGQKLNPEQRKLLMQTIEQLQND